MFKSARKNAFRWSPFAAKGPKASRLRRRRYYLAKKYGLPDELLGGCLSQVYRRCGKAGCHCQSSEGHPMWTLTYSVDGVKHTETVPAVWVKYLKPMLNNSGAFRDAVAEVRAINAQLLSLWKRQVRPSPRQLAKRAESERTRRGESRP